jgi:hypothetical protein
MTKKEELKLYAEFERRIQRNAHIAKVMMWVGVLQTISALIWGAWLIFHKGA